ncbi:hypothetical protein Tco_0863656 [Tanacetum coccineum]
MTHLNWREDGYCKGGDLLGIIRVGDMIYFQDYEWYEGLKDGDLKEETLKEKAILEGSWGMRIEKERIFALEEYWWGKKDDEESSEDACSNYLPNDEGINDDNDAIQASQESFDDHEPKNNDDDIGDIDDYLIP